MEENVQLEKEETTLKALYAELARSYPPTPTIFVREARKKGLHITFASARTFLRQQDGYALHAKRPTRRQEYLSRNTMTADWVGNLQGDLLILPQRLKRVNRGYHVILVLVDLYSRLLILCPMRNKSADELCRALEEALTCLPFQATSSHSFFSSHLSPMPNSAISEINFDKETAIRGRKVARLLNQYELKLLMIKKCFVAEAAIRLVKRHIARYTTESGSQRFIEFLQDFARAHNNSTSEGKLHTRLELATKPWLEVPQKPPKRQPRLHIGDTVRLLRQKTIFEKEGHRGNWSSELYMITYIDVSQPIPMYALNNVSTGEPLKGQQNYTDLLKVG